VNESASLRSIPVLDFQHLVAGGAVRAAAVDALARAAAEWGFLELRGHGVPPVHREKLFRLQRAFFALPDADKMALVRTEENARGYNPGEFTKNRRDAKEIFDFGHKPDPSAPDDAPVNRVADGWNQFPGALPGFEDTVWRWYGYCETLAFMLLEALGEALGRPREALTEAFGSEHTSFLRLNHYPASDRGAPADAPDLPEGELGIHHHTDAGVLTLLVQEGDPGLQVRQGGVWHLVVPDDDAFVVNIGDMMQVFANDAFQAPEHRVLATRPGGARQSAAFFFNPSYDAVIAPFADPPHYRPFTWGDFRGRRAAGDYADLGEEVQIAAWRIDEGAATA
jgi:isopenicillin N synthase-like dioxygenase